MSGKVTESVTICIVKNFVPNISEIKKKHVVTGLKSVELEKSIKEVSVHIGLYLLTYLLHGAESFLRS